MGDGRGQGRQRLSARDVVYEDGGASLHGDVVYEDGSASLHGDVVYEVVAPGGTRGTITRTFGPDRPLSPRPGGVGHAEPMVDSPGLKVWTDAATVEVAVGVMPTYCVGVIGWNQPCGPAAALLQWEGPAPLPDYV